MKILILIFLSIQFTAYSQNGFYGRVNSLDVKTNFYFPMLQRAFVYKYYGNGLKYDSKTEVFKQQTSKINYGIHVQYNHALGFQTIIGLNVGMDVWKMPAYGGYLPSSGSGHERLSIRTYTFLPVIEVSSRYSDAPVGLFHQFGVGMTMTHVVDKIYHRSADQTFSIDDIQFLEYEYNSKFLGLQIVYGIKMRSPIGKRWLINYGAKYTFDFNLSKRTYGSNSISSNIWRHHIANLITIETGISYSL